VPVATPPSSYGTILRFGGFFFNVLFVLKKKNEEGQPNIKDSRSATIAVSSITKSFPLGKVSAGEINSLRRKIRD